MRHLSQTGNDGTSTLAVRGHRHCSCCMPPTCRSGVSGILSAIVHGPTALAKPDTDRVLLVVLNGLLNERHKHTSRHSTHAHVATELSRRPQPGFVTMSCVFVGPTTRVHVCVSHELHQCKHYLWVGLNSTALVRVSTSIALLIKFHACNLIASLSAQMPTAAKHMQRRSPPSTYRTLLAFTLRYSNVQLVLPPRAAGGPYSIALSDVDGKVSAII